MKWKRTKGAQVVRDKVTGQIKPMAEVDMSLTNLANQAQVAQQTPVVTQGLPRYPE